MKTFVVHAAVAALIGLALQVKSAPVAAPSLSVRLTPEPRLALSWTNDAEGFVLESASQLGPGAAWQFLTSAFDLTPTHLTARVGPTAQSRFFRLRRADSPRLAIRRTETNRLEFSWAAGEWPFVLEQAPVNAATPVFKPVIALPTLQAGRSVLGLPSPAVPTYYRLRLAQKPLILAELVNDTGASLTDGITADAAVRGILASGVRVDGFRARFDGQLQYQDVRTHLAADGRFAFSREDLDAIRGEPLADGKHVLHLQALNSAGETIGAGSVPFTLDTMPPRMTLQPTDGEQDVLPRQIILATFDEPVRIGDNATNGFRPALAGSLTLATRSGPVAGRLVLDETGKRLHLIPNRDLAGGLEYEVAFDGAKVVDLAGNAFALPPRRAKFRTVNNAPLPNTAVAGFVFDSARGPGGANIPLHGATVRIASALQIQTHTDAAGRFVLTNVPAGRLLIDVDGFTVAAPAGKFYPTVAEVIEVIPGRTNQFPSPIFLPLANQAAFVAINNSSGAMTEVSNETELPGWKLMVPGGAVQRRDGSSAARILIAPVAPDRLPAPLPAGMDPSLVITIQTEGGADVFTDPVPITAPNLEGLPPGAKTVLWDFDHARGIFVPVATATVSADGRFVTTDPGQGVLRPGWHFVRNLVRIVFRPIFPKGVDKPGFPEALGRSLASSLVVFGDLGGVVAVFAPQFGIPMALLGAGAEAARNSLGGPDASAQKTENSIREQVLTTGGGGTANAIANYYQRGAEAARAGNPLVNPSTGLRIAGRTLAVTGGLIGIANLVKPGGDLERAQKDFADLSRVVNDPPGDYASQLLRASSEAQDHLSDLISTGREAVARGFEGCAAAANALAEVEALPDETPITPALRTQVEPLLTRAQERFNSSLALLNEFNALAQKAIQVLENFQALATQADSGRVYYRFQPGTGDALLGSGTGLISLDVQPGTSGNITFVEPIGGFIGAASLQGVRIAANVSDPPPIDVMLFPSRAADANGNTLPDDLDAVLGNPSRAQVELLRAGLPPDAAGLPLLGVLARHPVGYEDVALLDGLLVGVSTNGSADVLDTTRPFAPVVVATLAAPARPLITSSRDRARVFARGQRVVFTGKGAFVYDLSDARQPRLLFRDETTLLGQTTANGVLGPNHVVIESGGTLRSYDLASGQVVSSVELPGTGQVSDLVLFGDAIFLRRFQFFTADLTLAAVRLDADGRLTFLGSLQPFNIRQGDFGSESGLAIDHRALYLASFMTRQGPPNPGFGTFDISNPANLRLIAEPSVTNASGAARLATDGSGHLYLTVLAAPNSAVDVFDVSDPSNTGRRIASLPAATQPQALAIGNGLIAVTGPDGTSLARLLPADAGNRPPVISAITLRGGNTLTEGERLAVQVVATDDAAIARVELFLQGDNRVATDVSWPFDLDFAVPADLPNNQPLTLTARVTDTGGNVATQSVSLTYRATAPRVTSSTLAPGVTTNLALTSAVFTFDQPINRRLVTNSTFELRGEGADRQFNTPDDVLTPITFAFDASNTRLTLNFAGAPAPMHHRLTLRAATLQDRGGVALDGEFHGVFPSGSGASGSDFVLDFAVQRDLRLAPDAFPLRFFATETSTNEEKLVSALVLADVNGDGRDDALQAVAEGTNGTGRLFVTLQNADGTFASPMSFATHAHPLRVFFADVNGDGKLDALTLNFDEQATFGGAPDFVPNRVPFDYSLLLGNGDGTFQTARRIEVPGKLLPHRGDTVLADFTGDRRADLAQLVPDLKTDTAFFDSEMLLFVARADGTFAPPISTPTLTTNLATRNRIEREGPIAAADLNRDGKLDLVVDGFRSVAPGLVLLGRGDGTFQIRTNTLFGDDTSRLLLGDFTGDQVPDALYGDKILRGAGDGNFVQLPNNSLRTNNVFSGGPVPDLLADVTGDGLADFVVQLRVGFVPQLGVFRAASDGTFSVFDRVPLGFSAPSLRLNDVNGDARADLVLGVTGQDAGSSFGMPSGLAVVIANADRTFASPISLDVSRLDLRDAMFPVTGDLNGDGRLDVLAPTPRNPLGQIGIVLSTNHNQFAPMRVVRVTNDPNFFVRSQGIADLNGDGKLDVMVSDDLGVFTGTATTFVLLGNGDGTFQPARALGGINNVFSLADLTGDGKPDVLSAAAGFGQTLSLHAGNGDGTFGPATTIRVATTGNFTVNQALAADFNRDGKLDLVAFVQNAGTTILLNDGSGHFTPSATTPAALNSFNFQFVGFGDFTRDGIPDVVLRDSRDSFAEKLIIVPVTSEAKFAVALPPQPLAGSFQTVLRLADVNGDEVTDVITRGGRGADVTEARVSLCNGDGTFQAPLSLLGAGFGGPLIVDDFNRDGSMDLIVGNTLLLQRPRPRTNPVPAPVLDDANFAASNARREVQNENGAKRLGSRTEE